MPNKLYVVYDARARSEDTDDCAVLLATQIKTESLNYAKDYHGVVFEYDIKKGNQLENEQQIN